MKDRPFCIIPARGGSKRFPGKNVAELMGKPLVVWSVETALSSNLFGEVIVTTDDAAIASVAADAGARIFTRNASLADDTARLSAVCLDILGRFNSRGRLPDHFCLLQPTCPLRLAEDLRGSFRLLADKGANYVVSVCEYEDPPFWALHKDMDGFLRFYWGDEYITNRQRLPTLYYHNGSIIWARSHVFLREKEFMAGSRIVPYMMPFERSVDIDHPYQLRLAEFLLNTQSAALPTGEDEKGSKKENVVHKGQWAGKMAERDME